MTMPTQIDQQLPEYARGKGEEVRPPYQAADLPIPMADIRLVVPMRDDKTNEVRDVIVRHLRGGEPIVEREHGVSTPRHTRYIEGLDIEIPWPEAQPEDYKAEESDTVRLTVEERTYIPSINPPFPESVIDELRDPFHRERSRHEQAFIDKKLKEDALEAWKKGRRLLTPRAEYLEQRAKANRESQQAEVSDNLLQLIRQEQLRTLGRRKLEANAS
jgi:large subunit ribosomal protein L24